MFDGYLQGESTLAPQLDTRRQMPISKIPDLDEYEQELAKYEKEFNELNIQKIKSKNTPKYNEIMERRIKVFNKLINYEEKLRKNKGRITGFNLDNYVSKYTL